VLWESPKKCEVLKTQYDFTSVRVIEMTIDGSSSMSWDLVVDLLDSLTTLEHILKIFSKIIRKFYYDIDMHVHINVKIA
jgi:hypothetical protein